MVTLPSSHSPTLNPLYRQVIGLVMRSLESGEWKPGEVIPSETLLAARYGVSQGTVRKAIDELAAEHLLVRRQGKGTFVATHADPRIFSRFLRVAANDGDLQPLRSEPLGCWRVKAGSDICHALNVEEGASVMLVRRVVLSGEMPAIFDEVYLAADFFADLTQETLLAGDVSLYGLYESQFGVRVIRAEERVRAILADPVSARFLQVAEGEPLLLVERTTFSYSDRPVEFRRSIFSTRHLHYRNELV
ncbi:GntR family transcriptional regulator [Propionivibrio limicola]|uniref:GntR family transcriptional regulator n=1 Tax=Propionivibrio limicola TaxID=167645 RepID=UPI001290B6E2|nr:GntR family transcriptional regulator [Propionivibrio limicola]